MRAVDLSRGGARPWPDIEAVVVDPEGSLPPASMIEIINDAHSQGQRVLGVADDADIAGRLSELCDAVCILGIDVLPPVDIRSFSPLLFNPVGASGFGWIGGRAIPSSLGGPIEAMGEPVRRIGGANSQLITTAANLLGVIDTTGIHEGPGRRAERLTQLCAVGIPVLVRDLDSQTAALLGEDLASTLQSFSPADLADETHRERLSVALRRHALRLRAPSQTWKTFAAMLELKGSDGPLISILLSTNRGGYLERILHMVEAQSYENFELIAIQHGNDTPANRDLINRIVTRPVTVVPVSSSLNLGEALNVGSSAAVGEIVTKMDDDDWYGRNHLWDLLLAMEYSAADLVGKGAEFVYLAPLDITTRRLMGQAETASRWVAGGTLFLRKEDLLDLGGWPQLPFGVDQKIIDNALGAGKRIHRTHGFGYLYNRHGSGHTWEESIEYFLSQSQVQRRGLNLAFADCDATPDSQSSP